MLLVVKKLEWWGVGMVICLERGADMHMAQLMPLPLAVSCFSKIEIGFTFLALARLGSPRKGPLNGCVCVTANSATCCMKHDEFIHPVVQPRGWTMQMITVKRRLSGPDSHGVHDVTASEQGGCVDSRQCGTLDQINIQNASRSRLYNQLYPGF